MSLEVIDCCLKMQSVVPTCSLNMSCEWAYICNDNKIEPKTKCISEEMKFVKKGGKDIEGGRCIN